ncbi:MAG TPA: CoB--CoM heterodisulfide reductase iron-sulfur subunit A family protein, partial [Desulfurivibrio alkaliphilus]|nr:CoB--CoM heterodisulfide reductase iron-sulfur subunit A family protein [Desulfurivibrio alkaliphilus]
MEAGRSPNIEILSNTDLLELSGKPGAFAAKLRIRPRYIDPDKCTACGMCTQYCPRHLVDSYNEGLALTRPIHIDYPQAVPASYFIDPEACLHLKHGTCKICVPVCQSRAIDFSQQPEERTINVGAVVMAPGFGRVPDAALEKYGYGKHPDILTSLEFERLLCASGPFEGELLRLSDRQHPKKIAFIQCVGSRDLSCDNGYCSSVCCMYAIKEAMVAKEHEPDLEITIYYMDMRTQGKGFDAARTRAEAKGIKFVRARVADVMPWNKNLKLTYSTLDGSHFFEAYDMVVLSVGLDSPPDAQGLAKIADFELNRYNFCQTETFTPLLTSRPGVVVAGAFQGPKDIPESVTQSSAAAGLVSALTKDQRGKGFVVKTYPDEQAVTDEDEIRIGVFVCHCGVNISSVVDVANVDQYVEGMEGVVYHAQSLYSCSQDAQEVLKQKIREHNLNRVVIAACSPRTHEPLFQETLKDAGLNRCLFEMVNIRDQCSWVHANEPAAATAKSRDLVRMGIAKARHIKPLPEQTVPVIDKALVLGGGIAGMTAALSLAEQGFATTLVEREGRLGGHLLNAAYTLQGDQTAQVVKDLVARVKKEKNIALFTESELVQVGGFVGNFSSVVRSGQGKNLKETTVDHGVIIIATGGREHRPEKVLESPVTYSAKVITQSELESRLAGRAKSRVPKSVVMIQCAGSRGDDLNYCSKNCCNNAVKNALKIKEINPESQVVVLYRDLRTYGYAEDYYRQAREQGVLFIPYSLAAKPKLSAGKSPKVTFHDPILREEVTLAPDLLVLSTGIVPEGTAEMSRLLKVPVNEDKFYLEAHVKLRPVELPVSGVYVCGLAHSPKPVDEIVVQAQAAAAKAAIPLVKGLVTVEPTVSTVEQSACIGCGLCESLCPYQAIRIIKDENNKRKAETITASCKGCGICASHCPVFAISMGGFTDDQISAQIKAFGDNKE